jgi:ligand-binding sensor domain-containing protein
MLHFLINYRIFFGLIVFIFFGCVNSENISLWSTHNLGAHVVSIVSDKNDNIWIATRFSQIFQFDGHNWVEWNSSNTNGILPDCIDCISKLCVDSSGNLWVAAFTSIVKKEGTVWKKYNNQTNPEIFPNHNDDICCDIHGKIWIASEGITKFDGQSWKSFTNENSNGNIPPDGVEQIIADKSGTIWCSTFNDGIVSFDGNNWKQFRDTGLANHTITAIQSDMNGNIFAATYSDLWVYDGFNWKKNTLSTLGNFIPSDTLLCISFDKKNHLWLGASNGIASYTDGKFQHILSDNPVAKIGKFPRSLIVDQNNRKWFGFGDTEDIIWYSGD